jgi:predicted nucleotidyltransferase
MTRAEELQRKRKDILRLAKRYGVTRLRVFGSVARGEAGPDSDVDFLVEMEPGRSLFDLGGLLVELENLLQCQVDVITEKSLHWYIREKVLQEAKPL